MCNKYLLSMVGLFIFMIAFQAKKKKMFFLIWLKCSLNLMKQEHSTLLVR